MNDKNYHISNVPQHGVKKQNRCSYFTKCFYLLLSWL